MRYIAGDTIIGIATTARSSGRVTQQEAWAIAKEILKSRTGSLYGAGFTVHWWSEHSRRYFTINPIPLRSETRELLGQ